MSAAGSRPAQGGEETYPYFPLFIPLEDKRAVCVGGGRVAARRVATLLGFGARVTVVSPALCPMLATLADGGRVEWLARPYQSGDLAGASLALAAANDRAANHAAAKEAAARAIPISVADCRAECTFYFPAVARGGGAVAGIVSDTGASHRTAAAAARRVREALDAKTSDPAGQPQKPAGSGSGTVGNGSYPPRRAGNGNSACHHGDKRR